MSNTVSPMQIIATPRYNFMEKRIEWIVLRNITPQQKQIGCCVQSLRKRPPTRKTDVSILSHLFVFQVVVNPDIMPCFPRFVEIQMIKPNQLFMDEIKRQIVSSVGER
jgi:hypothetical protein